MFKRLWFRLLKKIYRKLILEVILLDTGSATHYLETKPFCVLEVKTAHGSFTFNFKEDRRLKRKKKFRETTIGNYIVEMLPPKELSLLGFNVEHHVILVVKVILFKINYEALVEVLVDIYLDTSLSIVET